MAANEDQLSRDERRARVWRQYLWDVLILLVCLMLLYALWSWKRANDVAGAAQARLMTIADKLEAKVDSVDLSKINAIADNAAWTLQMTSERVAALRDTQRELNRTIAALRADSGVLTGDVSKLITETRTQIKANGDATARLVADSNESVNGRLVPQLSESLKATQLLMTRFGATAEEASAAIKLASQQTGKSIDELNKVIVTGNATLTDFHTDLHDTMKKMPTIAANVEKTTRNISKFSKISIIAGIISNLANGFIPGLLH